MMAPGFLACISFVRFGLVSQIYAVQSPPFLFQTDLASCWTSSSGSACLSPEFKLQKYHDPPRPF